MKVVFFDAPECIEDSLSLRVVDVRNAVVAVPFKQIRTLEEFTDILDQYPNGCMINAVTEEKFPGMGEFSYIVAETENFADLAVKVVWKEVLESKSNLN